MSRYDLSETKNKLSRSRYNYNEVDSESSESEMMDDNFQKRRSNRKPRNALFSDEENDNFKEEECKRQPKEHKFNFVEYRMKRKGADRVQTVDIKGLRKLIKKHKTGYELCKGLCVPYYDFDFGYSTKEEQINNKEADDKRSSEAVKKAFAGVPGFRMYKLSACGYNVEKKKWKNSFHYIVRGCGYFESGKAIMTKHPVDEMDVSVYKSSGMQQLFRLPYCKKENDVDRYLIHDNKKFNAISDDLFNLLTITYIGNEKLVKVEGLGKKKRTRARSSNVKLSYSEKQIRRLFYLLKPEGNDWEWEEWRDIMWLVRNVSKQCEFDGRNLAHEISMLSDKYNDDETDEIFDAGDNWEGGGLLFGSLIRKCKEANPKGLKKWRDEARVLQESATLKKQIKELRNSRSASRADNIHQQPRTAACTDSESSGSDFPEPENKQTAAKYKEMKTQKREEKKRQSAEDKEDFKMLFGGDLNQAKLFMKYNKKNIKIINDKGKGYAYNKLNCLWEETSQVHIANLISPFAEHICNRLLICGAFTESEETKISTMRVKVCSTGNTRAVFEKVKSMLYDPKFEQKLDVSKYLLPVRDNQIVDLKTGIFRERKREDMFSKFCDVGKTEIGEELHKLIDPIMLNRPKLKRYIQKLFGLCLSGDNNRQFWICHGEGANGKTVLFEILKNILGGYYCGLDKSAIIKSKSHKRIGSTPTPELTGLKGSRLAVSQELERDDILNDTLTKRVAENQTLMVRNLNEDFWEMVYHCKLFIPTNFIGKIDTTDKAMLDRVVYLPFGARFVENPTKPNEFKRDAAFAESFYKAGNLRDMFFTWCLEGAQEYFKNGLVQCEEILEKTKKMIGDMDNVQGFIEDRFQLDAKCSVRSETFFADYKRYCLDDLGESKHETSKAITKIMQNKGFEYRRTSRKYYGLKYRAVEEDVQNPFS